MIGKRRDVARRCDRAAVHRADDIAGTEARGAEGRPVALRLHDDAGHAALFGARGEGDARLDRGGGHVAAGSRWRRTDFGRRRGKRGCRSSEGRRAALIEEQAFARAAAVEQHMVEGDTGELQSRRDLLADGVARLHPVLAGDDRRAAARRFVEVDPEESEPRRGHRRGGGTLYLAAEEGIEAGEERAPFGGRRDDGGLRLPRAERRQRCDECPEQADALPDQERAEQTDEQVRPNFARVPLADAEPRRQRARQPNGRSGHQRCHVVFLVPQLKECGLANRLGAIDDNQLTARLQFFVSRASPVRWGASHKPLPFRGGVGGGGHRPCARPMAPTRCD
ncbi:protein of unknown function [uncultured Sphingopyxis sp.]|uniref:Uncharacterized protein n=1 Tax=uncultured Sphingopyxis sp. TaxID=310581 RepID=A0A1Y5PV09_9SPHN|nr:protein of unknown function [uncultured Sphingopyxis sp.]